MHDDMRIDEHPILTADRGEPFRFTFDGHQCDGYEGETIAAALYANGFRTFGTHVKDGAPQGLFCANGQCAQCLVVVGGTPVKACMTPVRPGQVVTSIRGVPRLPEVAERPAFTPPSTVSSSVLIIGGGPAGLSAAIELGERGVDVVLVDDKDRLGGKLVLQTHRFFGSINAVYAGTRGIDIATRLEDRVRELDNVQIWLNSTALAVFSDGKMGVLREGDTYVLVEPSTLLVATGAREKSLTFKGNTLPGVYGAGAFQTLVNRDLVKASERLFIVGGGNVGLIAGYHALQAGIQVVGLVEALPECSGYKVHMDKLARAGVPIYTAHTVVSANGSEGVESVTIAAIDDRFQPIAGTEKSFDCDTVLIAIGLDPVNEFTGKARAYGLPVFAAGDADEIAEASAAMFSGKISGLEIARFLGRTGEDVPPEWQRTAELLRSRPGPVQEPVEPLQSEGVVPIFHCSQQIPCNPCTSVCSQGLIFIDEDDIRQVPRYLADELGGQCVGCEKCVTICPGLAITLVDFRKDDEMPLVTIPYEFGSDNFVPGDMVTVLDVDGEVLGEVEVARVRASIRTDHTVVVKVRAPSAFAKRIAGIRVQEPWVSRPLPAAVERLRDDEIVCRCERVTAGEIRELIRAGYRDVNEIKGVTRATMGACGAKTCAALIDRLFREEGVAPDKVTPATSRPLFVEVPLGVFAGATAQDDTDE
jgi:NADPH-dependent 2,4-dienoyl-CoA reductase/sulfur reductase-like enzyme/ferredoxin